MLFEREKGGNWLRIVSGVCTRKTSSSLTHAASMYTSTCERWRGRRVDGAIAWAVRGWRAR